MGEFHLRGGLMYKKAICNEMFGTMELSCVCDILNTYGFDGIEIAPFTLLDDKEMFSDSKIEYIKTTLRAHHLEFAGFHWLLAHPKGLHITSPNVEVRKRSVEHLIHLLNVSGELGGGTLILGSPHQRSVEKGKEEQGRALLEEGLRELGDVAIKNNSTMCMEALSSNDTNIINTLEEAKTLVHSINSKGVSSMFDFHNCGDETLSWDELIDYYYPIIQHVHLNTLNGGHPTVLDIEAYLPSFATLKSLAYKKWVSLEIFTVPENPIEVVKQTAHFLQEIENKLL